MKNLLKKDATFVQKLTDLLSTKTRLATEKDTLKEFVSNPTLSAFLTKINDEENPLTPEQLGAEITLIKADINAQERHNPRLTGQTHPLVEKIEALEYANANPLGSAFLNTDTLSLVRRLNAVLQSHSDLKPQTDEFFKRINSVEPQLSNEAVKTETSALKKSINKATGYVFLNNNPIVDDINKVQQAFKAAIDLQAPKTKSLMYVSALGMIDKIAKTFSDNQKYLVEGQEAINAQIKAFLDSLDKPKVPLTLELMSAEIKKIADVIATHKANQPMLHPIRLLIKEIDEKALKLSGTVTKRTGKFFQLSERKRAEPIKVSIEELPDNKADKKKTLKIRLLKRNKPKTVETDVQKILRLEASLKKKSLALKGMTKMYLELADTAPFFDHKKGLTFSFSTSLKESSAPTENFGALIQFTASNSKHSKKNAPSKTVPAFEPTGNEEYDLRKTSGKNEQKSQKRHRPY